MNQILRMAFLILNLAISQNAFALNCWDLDSGFNPTKIVTAYGTYLTSKSAATGTIAMRIGKETITFAQIGENKVQVRSSDPTVKNLRYFVVNFSWNFHPEITTNRMERKVARVASLVFFVIHPTHGLLAVDSSGIVVRMNEEIAALRADEIKSVFLGQSPEGKTSTVVLVTSFGPAYKLKLSQAYEPGRTTDNWPTIEAEKLVVKSIIGPPEDPLSFAFLSLPFVPPSKDRPLPVESSFISRQDDKLNGLQWRVEPQKIVSKVFGKDSNVSYSGRPIILPIWNGQLKYLVADQHGIWVWDPNTNQVANKSLRVDVSLKVNLEILSVFDLPNLGLILILTKSGHVKKVSRTQLLNTSDDSFDFINPVFVEGEDPKIELIGEIVKTELLPKGNGVRVVAVKPVLKPPSQDYFRYFSYGDDYFQDTYTVEVLSNGRTLIMHEIHQKRSLPNGG